MPSIEETKRQVKDSLRTNEPNHDDILASLQDEIDKHNAVKDEFRHTFRSSRRHGTLEAGEDGAQSMRFRFKSTHLDPRHRKRRSHHDHDRDEGRYRKSRRNNADDDEPTHPGPTAHPFPREPTDPSIPPDENATQAFRSSLFDALADDEGAQYWESVYNQPIHIYSRSSVPNPLGELEQMDDEEYVAYVKTKMWERKNPEVVLERERGERKRREAEEQRAREREEFVRRKEQAAWERAQRRFGGRGDDEGGEERYERTFAGESEADRFTIDAKDEDVSMQEYAQAWSDYLAAWDKLKLDLLAKVDEDHDDESSKISKRIPWPVLSSKPVLKHNIEAFMRHAPTNEDRSKLQTLKAERVRWHPDKVQQRFGGRVDEGTMRLVTGVFQVVDSIFEEERKRT